MKNYLLLFCIAVLSLGAKAAFVPVTLSGFNSDIIANGIGNASATTTAAVDQSNWALVSADFQATSLSPFPAAALPANGVISSVQTSGLKFQLAGYSANNGLVLSALSSSATLTAGTATAGDIYVLGFTGNGPTTATIMVTFTDNTTQSFTGITFDDWYGGTGYAIQGIGRVSRANNTVENPTGDPRLYERKLTLGNPNNARQIASITVTKTSATGVLNIIAVSVDNLCSSVSGLAASGVTGNTANISWNTVAGSLGYEYILDQNPADPLAAGTLTSSNTYNALGLNTNTTFYMHVRNKCSSITYSDWVTTSFTTLNTPITCNAPVSVSLSYITSSSAMLSWSLSASVQGYQYVVDQLATNPTSGWTNTATPSVSITGLAGGTSYYAHVRSVCGPGNFSNWVNIPFTTGTCNAPANVIISNITGTDADMMWGLTPNATMYEYAVNFNNQPPTTGITQTTAISTHLSSLIPNSKYYVHTRSRCFTSDSSDWRLDSFITLMVCYTPQVQVNNLGSNSPDAFWQPIPTAVAYEYTLTNTAAVPAFGTEIPAAYVSLTLPADGKDYYLHVRAKCNSMFTVSSWATVALRTNTSGVTGVAGLAEFQVFPNPASDVLHIAGADGTQYIIADMTGRQVAGGICTGHTAIDIRALAKGIYTLKISGRGISAVARFTKQ